MRTFKFMLFALVVAMSTSLYANRDLTFVSTENTTTSSVSYEIEKLLRNSSLVVEQDFTVTILFRVTGERKIEIQRITSPNDEVNRFLKKRLQGYELKGRGWFTDKLYELPVLILAKR